MTFYHDFPESYLSSPSPSLRTSTDHASHDCISAKKKFLSSMTSTEVKFLSLTIEPYINYLDNDGYKQTIFFCFVSEKQKIVYDLF
jgi:hypothetical protein